MEGFTLSPWQVSVLALVCVIAGAVVATYLKPAAKPDQKRKNDD